MTIVPMKTGDEYDLLSRKSRRMHKYACKPGVCKYAKRSYNRRVRRHFKDMLHGVV